MKRKPKKAAVSHAALACRPTVAAVCQQVEGFQRMLAGKDMQAKAYLTATTAWNTPAVFVLVREVRRLQRAEKASRKASAKRVVK